MKNEQSKSRITDLAAMVVFVVFAVCVLMVLLAGANSYQSVTARGQLCYDRRTAAQYLAMHLRQADRAGGVEVQSFDGVDALVLHDTVDGQPYITRIYCWQGHIRELFGLHSGSFSPEDGEVLLPAERLTFAVQDSMLELQLEFADGTKQALTLYLRSKTGGAV